MRHGPTPKLKAECVRYESPVRAEQGNPAEPRVAKLDCFAPLAMTVFMQIFGVLLSGAGENSFDRRDLA